MAEKISSFTMDDGRSEKYSELIVFTVYTLW